MMQSTQYRLREHSDTLLQSMAGFHFLNHSQYARRIRDSRTQAAVRSTSIVVFYPTCQDWAQMRLRYRDQPIQALPTDRADHPFTNRVGFRGVQW